MKTTLQYEIVNIHISDRYPNEVYGELRSIEEHGSGVLVAAGTVEHLMKLIKDYGRDVHRQNEERKSRLEGLRLGLTISDAVIAMTGPRIGQTGIIVDVSDSHGLCYGVVFPNISGADGRQDSLSVYWFEPNELKRKRSTT
jgi:hypothetical protein